MDYLAVPPNNNSLSLQKYRKTWITLIFDTSYLEQFFLSLSLKPLPTL